MVHFNTIQYFNVIVSSHKFVVGSGKLKHASSLFQIFHNNGKNQIMAFIQHINHYGRRLNIFVCALFFILWFLCVVEYGLNY